MRKSKSITVLQIILGTVAVWDSLQTNPAAAEMNLLSNDGLKHKSVQDTLEEFRKKEGEKKVVFEIENSPTQPTLPEKETPEPSGILPRPIVLYDRDGWNVGFSGFVELDVISDSTRSFTESPGNNPIDRSNTTNGANGRTQFSLRNTRLAFTIQAPQVNSWKTKAFLETDFLGFDPNPPGASGAGNTEAGLYNNPTLRIRHAYFQGNLGGFQILAGQSWQLFGWQPYYFMSTDEVAPIAAMLYGRTAQIRGMQTLPLGEDVGSLQIALSAARPPERDGIYPDMQGGMRLALNGRTSAFTGGSAGAVKNQPLSFAFSALARNISVPTPGNPRSTSGNLATAIALDTMIPVIASPDGKETGNTLSLLSEYTTGSGYGDQFVGWTGNMASPLSSSKITPSSNLNLDGGIGDYDSGGNFSLVNLSSLNVHLQYHLPQALHSFVDVGVGQLYSNNMSSLLPSAGLTSGGKTPYERVSVGFMNIFHDFTNQIRAGFEYAHMETAYSDGGIGFNNRYQISTQFIF